MRICLTSEDGAFKTIEVSADIELENLAPIIEAELAIPVASQKLFFNGAPLLDHSRSLASYKVTQDDIILVSRAPGAAANASGSSSSISRAETARQHILGNPDILSRLTQQNPEFASALSDPARFERLFAEMERQRTLLEQQQRQYMDELNNSDMFDIESQRKIAEEIRRANIAQNMETAIEYHPESFGKVIMLYINCEVNGHPVKAFVDSGAQATIMSPDCAEKCHIMHLLDERFSGVAHGVGIAKILGRIHSTQFKVGTLFLPCALTVMEMDMLAHAYQSLDQGKGVDLLFGLDMLKRHQACIDLEKNVLRISGVEVPFLQEHELPEKARLEAVGEHKSEEGKSGNGPSPSSAQLTSKNASSSNQGSSSGAAPSHASAGGASRGLPSHPESHIKSLIDLGASREQAIAALDACGGDPDLAAGMLF